MQVGNNIQKTKLINGLKSTQLHQYGILLILLFYLKRIKQKFVSNTSCLGCELCPNIKWPNQDRLTMLGEKKSLNKIQDNLVILY